MEDWGSEVGVLGEFQVEDECWFAWGGDVGATQGEESVWEVVVVWDFHDEEGVGLHGGIDVCDVCEGLLLEDVQVGEECLGVEGQVFVCEVEDEASWAVLGGVVHVVDGWEGLNL